MGRKCQLCSDHGAQVLPRPLEFWLAPSRVEYPTLSMEAATGMPIEVFIGQNREATLNGRFIAFSKRINSVLVPESFLTWANQNLDSPTPETFSFSGRKVPLMVLPAHGLNLSR